MSVQHFRAAGYLPEAMCNWLVRIGWSHGDQELFSRDEMRALFDLAEVHRAAGQADPGKLDWLNQHYIKELPRERLVRELLPFLAEAGTPVEPSAALEAVVDLLRERSKTLAEMAQRARFFAVADAALVHEADAVRKHWKAAARAGGEGPRRRARRASSRGTIASIEAAFHAVLARHEGLALGKLAQPVRVAVTGSAASPGIFETLALLGRERSVARLERALASCRPRERLEKSSAPRLTVSPLPRSSNGRTTGSGPVNEGSNPSRGSTSQLDALRLAPHCAPSRSTRPRPPRSRAASANDSSTFAHRADHARALLLARLRLAQRRAERADLQAQLERLVDAVAGEPHRLVHRLVRDLREARALRGSRARASASPNANGPGASGGGGAGNAMCCAAAITGAIIHGFLSRGCQQTKASRPPGRSARRRFANAATGSAKNITPKREKTTSNGAGFERGDLRVVEPERDAPVEPARSRARCRARSSIGREMSTATTLPGRADGVARARASCRRSRSRRRARARPRGSRRARARSAPSGPICASSCSCCATHTGPALSFQY